RIVAEGEAAAAEEEPSVEEVDAMVQMLRGMGAPLDDFSAADAHEAVRMLMIQTRVKEHAEEDGREAIDVLKELVADSIVIFFDSVDELDPTYVDWIKTHGLKYPSRQGVPFFFAMEKGGEQRNFNEREVRAVTIALDALNQFLSANGQLIEQTYN